MFPPYSSIVPIITPFQTDLSIDYVSLSKMIEWQIDQGSDGIVCFGTTGESPTLTFDEKLDLLKFILEITRGKIPVIANCGTNSTQESLNLTIACKELGADCGLTVVPYYNRPSERGCIEHFTKLSQVGLPLILYHIPSRTQVTLSFNVIEKILNLPNFIGIKECSGDLHLFAKLAKHFPSKNLFSGSDLTLLDEIKSGANGSIGAIANIIPKTWSNICKLAHVKPEEADEIFSPLLPALNAIYSETNPSGVKYALSLLGYCKNQLRLPMVTLSSEGEKKVALHSHLLKF
ncbi:MAG: 4-hydroxy-tetrahydrodipicolinate synthase [Rhabdochlamydiaceae bacterium]|nr:4-hydroxy-tetrahydrodipicolinate synthase [Candidatus Amphrikana amoebophyrae]